MTNIKSDGGKCENTTSVRSFSVDNGAYASSFCFGCEPLGGADWGDDVNIGEIQDAIERAISLGVNFFDAADVYGLGLSETRLSKILGERRHDLIIATKGGVSWKRERSGRAVTRIDCSPDYIRVAVENSLKRLRVDRIPVYYIHWPEEGRDVAEAVDVLFELQNSGKIGMIGCSNFSAVQLKRALECAPIRFLQIPVNILMGWPDFEIAGVCKENKVGVAGYNVLASGLLTGKFDANTVFPHSDRRSRLPQFVGDGLRSSIHQVERLRVDAECLGLSLAQYSIKKILEQTAIETVIVGIKRPQQLDENITPFYTKEVFS